MWLGCFDADLVLVWSCLVGFRLLWVLIWVLLLEWLFCGGFAFCVAFDCLMLVFSGV